ncbi:sulfurtransferase [Sediminispirochaeta smaragdinae]|uniref:Rhodanese domain protein n=1 Tax=Sediminispirochaeta smaragdinae (strain DSM 11293 / JCM 15392 / SEBR 4228) TaxID=573413 RepID=E1R846_SEDSS|nr:rhodanese-like domain-containing protein [Sediminispirochaeta smaragdinae]ADK82901.1 Rhodanese domain protein [Sediminispirochaeta smaragdinae DSM 11293]
MKFRRKMPIAVLAIVAAVGFISCGGPHFAESGSQIIDAKDALAMVQKGGVVLVDAQTGVKYNKEHADGAVNIGRADIVVNTPYPNLVADKAQFEKVMQSRGISNDSTVVAYDDSKNMDAARLWWTMVAYGHDPEKVKVISGGLAAMKAAGSAMSSGRTTPASSSYTAKDFDTSMIATLADVKAQVNNPDSNTVILDTRTTEEVEAGTIPGSVHIDYENNNFSDNTYRPVQQIRIDYLEKEIDPSKTVIMFCKTSIRGAQSYVALYNAGYRNLKLYDGAWVEWSSKPSLPVQMPEKSELPALNSQDGS